MSTLIKLTIILVALVAGTYYWSSTDTKNNLDTLSENFQKDTFKKSPLAKEEDSQAHTQILSIKDAGSKEDKEKQDKEEKVNNTEEMEADILGEPVEDNDYLVESTKSDKNIDEKNEESKKKASRELKTPEKKDGIVAEKKQNNASQAPIEETDQLSVYEKEEDNNKLPETPSIDDMLEEDAPKKSAKEPTISKNTELSKEEGDMLTTAEQPAHKIVKDPFTEVLDPSTPQKNASGTETFTDNDPDVYADMFESNGLDKATTATRSLDNFANSTGETMSTPSIDETIDGETSLPKSSSAQPSLSNPLITTDIAQLKSNGNQIETSQTKTMPKEVEENVEIPEALYLPSRRKNADDRIGIKPTNVPENSSEMMDMSEATSSINRNATYPNQVNTPSNRTNNWTNSVPNNMQNNCCIPQNNMSNMNNGNNGQNWNNGNYNQNQNGYNNCCYNMQNNNQQSNNMPSNNGWNNGMNGNMQNNLPTSGRNPKLLSGDYKNITPEEKIAMTPFEAIPAGSGTCEFEHVIDADNRTETFRMVMLGTENSNPFKIETKRPLELSKYLTMHIDEIDGYPDEFSSLSVFCKNMRIKKTLVENF